MISLQNCENFDGSIRDVFKRQKFGNSAGLDRSKLAGPEHIQPTVVRQNGDSRRRPRRPNQPIYPSLPLHPKLPSPFSRQIESIVVGWVLFIFIFIFFSTHRTPDPGERVSPFVRERWVARRGTRQPPIAGCSTNPANQPTATEQRVSSAKSGSEPGAAAHRGRGSASR